MAKVISDNEGKLITAIVDEDQLSLAIGKNGQNVRLASQLIGWQIDLYSSREWMERGAEAALFGGAPEDERAADFPLKELDIAPATLAALEAAGHNTFLGVINLERDDFLRIPGLGPEETDGLVKLIEELTIVEEPAELSAEMPPDAMPVASGGPFTDDAAVTEAGPAEEPDEVTAEGAEPAAATAESGPGEPEVHEEGESEKSA